MKLIPSGWDDARETEIRKKIQDIVQRQTEDYIAKTAELKAAAIQVILTLRAADISDEVASKMTADDMRLMFNRKRCYAVSRLLDIYPTLWRVVVKQLGLRMVAESVNGWPDDDTWYEQEGDSDPYFIIAESYRQ